jgi:hypothetical protein
MKPNLGLSTHLLLNNAVEPEPQWLGRVVDYLTRAHGRALLVLRVTRSAMITDGLPELA